MTLCLHGGVCDVPYQIGEKDPDAIYIYIGSS